MNYHQIKKKNRPLTPAEQVGMTSLLSGIKMLRQQAVTRGNDSPIHPENVTSEINPVFQIFEKT
ncbi:MAG: hypothetical protein HIU83_15750 [Proteobacteria bacterium]|nr:hypothetical protein [Pseudomonadota bacterium]